MLQKCVMVPTTDGCSVPVDLYAPEPCRFVNPDVRRPAILVVPGGEHPRNGPGPLAGAGGEVPQEIHVMEERL